VARWPDATFEDGKIWRMMEGCRRTDGGYNEGRHEWLGKSRLGLAYDDCFRQPDSVGFREGDTRYKVNPSIGFDNQPGSLADSGKDFTGALAVLNIGHWLTWTRPITEHAAGSDHFKYDPFGIEMESVHRFSAYHILGLPALDRPNEWWFDKDSKTVYFMPQQGVDPNSMNLRGRIRDYGLELSDCSDITVQGIRFHGAGFFVRSCSRVTVEDCTFDYPATHKFMLGALDYFSHGNPKRNPNTQPSIHRGENNRFINNIVRRSNAPLYFGSRGMLVENCLFEDIEWEPNSAGYSGSVMIGEGGVFRRNTITRGGNSEGLRGVSPGATIELNHIFDMSNLQHDGAALNVGTRDHYRARVSQNWAHDCNRQGVRFDYHGTAIYREDGAIHGDGVYMRNVTWNTEPNELKGDRHLVLNNTIPGVNRYPDPFKEEVTMSIQGFKILHDINGNMNSLIRNNLGTLLSRTFHLDKKPKKWWVRSDGSMMLVATVLPGTVDHNMREAGASWKYLRDPANYDFRPKAGSPLVDAGSVVRPGEVPSPVASFTGLDYEGQAPDIGAYEFGAKRYWIPGRQERVATTPVPKNGGVNVPLDADLMFLEAYKSTKHRIMFGAASDSLKQVAVMKDLSTNIVKPPELMADTTYYWRVDAIDQSGAVRTGPIWHFKTTKK
jgi:hypothetical protein